MATRSVVTVPPKTPETVKVVSIMASMKHVSRARQAAQPIDRIAPELRELIEEQDAVVRERSRMYLERSFPATA